MGIVEAACMTTALVFASSQLTLDGVPATAQTLTNKTYPFPLRICLVAANQAVPAVARFIAHLRSTAGQSLIESLGAAMSE
jgi:hypothetical protein